MNMKINLGTLNLCLGLTNKKEIVKRLINDENIDILCLQETELTNNLDHNLMSFPGYVYETENNDECSRVGCYLSTRVTYTRRTDLEGKNAHLIVLDVKANKDIRIINVYRSFNPINYHSPYEFFKYQMDLISEAYNTKNTILLGDFNLDWDKKDLINYPFKRYFEYMDEKLIEKNLVQIVTLPTWSRFVNGNLRESLMDHIYLSDPTIASDLKYVKPVFGDHLLLLCGIECTKNKEKFMARRSWTKYNKIALCDMLRQEDWNIESDSVQGTWNIIENKIVKIVDKIVPMVTFVNNSKIKQKMDPAIRTKINKRKKLLMQQKKSRNEELRQRIKVLDKEIRSYFVTMKASHVRRSIIPGNSGSLWKAVKAARDVNSSELPDKMYLNGILIEEKELPDAFANFFDTKIKNIASEITIENDVYNGKRIVEAEDKMFMTRDNIRECIMSLKPKNSEGYDRIPQRILLDGMEILLSPLTKLFEQIYNQKTVPDQWLVAKTIPIFKNKGEKNKMENYRPIANLCSASKFFEKLILKRINEIQDQNQQDITRPGQHGFKRNRSTLTLSLELQSMIARALDNDEFVLVASLDLSSAFDVVNINLLLKRMRIIGLPPDVVDLVKVWLKERCYYVSINSENSCLFDLLLGTVQGSVLGPVLYAIFVSPLFDIVPILAFADDSYDVKTNKNKNTLVEDMKKSLESITKWLKKSGLKVNNEKTDLCLFYRHDTSAVSLNLGDITLKSKNEINVLGVLFDSKMQWSNQVAKTIKKASKALNAIKLIRKYFTSKELLQLLTSNYYSILYYNSEVWHTGSLKQNIRSQLFSASGNALRVAMHYPSKFISFSDLHKMANRATPDMYKTYRLSLILYRTFNEKLPEVEWIDLNFKQINMSRQEQFKINKNNRFQVGLNIICNRLHELNGLIHLDWLNFSKNAYKIACKNKFLTFVS